jgi:acyl carrier protein
MDTTEAVLEDVIAMVRAVRGDDARSVVIAPGTRFAADLGMASVDLVVLAGRVQAKYGGRVNFTRLAAGANTDFFTRLSVGELVSYVINELEDSATL